MQRWEYLWVKVAKDWVDLRFTHEQPVSILSLFPCDPKQSSGREVRIDTTTGLYEKWAGPWWLTQLADDGWELVSATASCTIPGLMAGTTSLVRDIFFRRPLA